MATKIFVNLPVKDLKKSIEFYKKLGFSINPQFTLDICPEHRRPGWPHLGDILDGREKSAKIIFK